MSKKLFQTPPSVESQELSPPSLPALEPIRPDDELTDSDYAGLENFVAGYCSVGRVYDSVAAESLIFVDQKNHVLYNEYVAMISHKLGVKPPASRTVSTEDFETRSIVAVNSQIALEGWMGDMWRKIKGFFVRIYEKVKAFFKRYFTRLGRAKGGLQNIIDVLKETDKDLKKAYLDNYTGSVLDKFRGTKALNVEYVKQVTDNVVNLNKTIATVNKSASELANKHLVSPGFIANIKNMKELAKSSAVSKKDVEGNKPGLLKAVVDKDARAERKDAKETSANLDQIGKEASKTAVKDERKVQTSASLDAGSEEANAEQAKREFGIFSSKVHESLSKFVNKPLIAGKTFTKVGVSEALELEIDMATSDEKPDSITLGDKTQLNATVKNCLDMIVSMEKDIKEYGKINDTIMSKLSAVDSIVTEIDKEDPEKFGKYKKLINEQVRARLQLMQKFFSDYNKIGKNVFDIGIETCEAVTAYGVLSLKHFG